MRKKDKSKDRRANRPAKSVGGGSEPKTNKTRRKPLKREFLTDGDFLADILDYLPHPFYVIDAHDYSIKLANSAAGSRVSENMRCYALTHMRSTPCPAGGCLCPLDEVKRTRKSVVMEHVHYDAGGNARYVEVHGHPVFDTDGNVVQMIEYSLDITERKQAEEERLQKEKLQGVLETAGAACHELNQPIQVLFAYVHSLLKQLSEADPLRENVQQIKQEIQRIAQITHKLNNITRYESREYFRDTKIIDIDKASS